MAQKSGKVSRLIRAASLVLCFCVMMPGMPAYAADTIEEAEAERDALDQQKAELDGKLADLQNDENEKVAYQATLQEKITVVQEEIETTRADIQKLDKEITALEAKIQAAEDEMGDTINLFYERIRSIYMSGSSQMTTLEVLLNADSLHDFAMKSKMMQSINERDSQIADQIQTYLDATKEDRESCQAKQDELAQQKKDLDTQNAELADLNTQNEEALAAIGDQKAATAEEIARVDADRAAADAQVESLIEAKRLAEEEAERQRQAELAAQLAAQSANEGSPDDTAPGEDSYTEPITPSGGQSAGDLSFCWPLPGVSYISCYYGEGGHNGMDIAGAWGTPVVAAESGQVVDANGSDDWGQSWGYYVLIYHNGTYSTRYAHLSSLAVGNGEYVSKGQVVGYEGSTGYSTGPHLHFEIYQNNVRVNPLPFISG